MNSFFIERKIKRADKIIAAIDTYIEAAPCASCHHVPGNMPNQLIKDIAIYCNDYEINMDGGVDND
jgi:hypothetical protein